MTRVTNLGSRKVFIWMLASSRVYKGPTMSQAERIVLLDAEGSKEKCKIYLPSERLQSS